MKLEDLNEKVIFYKQSQTQIEENRTSWTTTTKNLIITTLTKIIDHYQLNCKVESVDLYKNYEAVNLTFGHFRSGIVKEKEHETRHFKKFGGALSFSQSCNGKIDVIILFPFIEQITGKTDADKKVLEQVPATEINEPFIFKQVSRFLDELVTWEDEPKIPTVGYKFPDKTSSQQTAVKVLIGEAAAKVQNPRPK